MSSLTRAARSLVLNTYDLAYERLARPVIFRRSAQDAHERMLTMLARLDGARPAVWALGGLHALVARPHPVTVGGVTLPSPLILAAGFVKGHGFADEDAAHAAVERGENIIPGWRTIPRLLGPVEYGSFTRWPRLGNPGVVVWRHPEAHATQNRVGLRNPGAQAAARFLARRASDLPQTYGINIAVSPGVSDPAQERREVIESIAAFLDAGLRPAWITLNLSCPNTEDDPGNRQTESGTRALCDAVIAQLAPQHIPLWVKIGPTLAEAQIRVLMRVFAETGVRAAIATNTLPMPAPSDPALSAGVAGRLLHARALAVAGTLLDERARTGADVDVIGCGGVEDGATARAFLRAGASAVQYWSALVYRGPLAPALIAKEAFRDA